MYKIIVNDKIIGLIRNPRFVRFLPNGHTALTDSSSAHGFIGSDRVIYSFTKIPGKNYTVVSLDKITSETEFSRLQSLLNSEHEISADESALAAARRETIKRLSNICKSKITSGFSIILSDGESYNFKLTTEDQLNLMSIEGQLNTGAETFIYHATNQPCKFFSREDMTKIIATFKRYILYHTTYFNVAKQYINSLTDIEKVNRFTYGTDVSEAIEDVVIKQILKNGGNLV